MNWEDLDQLETSFHCPAHTHAAVQVSRHRFEVEWRHPVATLAVLY